MERLTGIDANFLYMETPAAHMHTIKVAVLEPAPGARYDLDSVKTALRPRLALLPQFRRRVIEVPLGLHHPVWVEDPGFTLDEHVHALALHKLACVQEAVLAPLCCRDRLARRQHVVPHLPLETHVRDQSMTGLRVDTGQVSCVGITIWIAVLNVKEQDEVVAIGEAHGQ